MAKSLRSKFKRKIRSLARVKKGPKEYALLASAVFRREAYEREQAGREAEAKGTICAYHEHEAMDSTSSDPVRRATININTMKRADGTYPPWLSATMKNKLSKKNKDAKKKKLRRAKSKR